MKLIRRPVLPPQVTLARKTRELDLHSPAFDGSGHTLSPYQLQGIEWLLAHGRGILGDDMGTGKTAQVLRSRARGSRTLVFSRKSVKNVWRGEAAKWTPWLSVDTQSGLRKPRANEIVVCAYSELPESLGETRRLITEPLGDVDAFVDEAQDIKNKDAQLTKKVRCVLDHCRSVHLLTGTPMVGDAEDLWGLLLAGKLNEICFPSTEERQGWDEFIELCNGEKKTIWKSIKTKEGVKRVPIGEKMHWGDISPVVHERIKRVMLRRTKAEVMPQLPPKRYQKLVVDAPADLRDFLDTIKEDWNFVDEDTLPPIQLLTEARLAISRARIPDACDYVNSQASFETPMLVFSNFVEPVQAVGRLANVAVLTGETADEDERSRLIADFQVGKYRAIAMTRKTGGAGITLTRAQTVLNIDLDWSPGNNDQGDDRASRLGNPHSVLIVDMVSDHIVDQHIHELLRVKRMNIGRAIDGKEVE